MKKTKPRVAKTPLVPVRRSLRFSNKSAPQFKQVKVYKRVQIPRRLGAFLLYSAQGPKLYRTGSDASDEARERAMRKAEKLESSLGSDHPTFVRSMLPSHVSGGFWLRILPKNDGVIQLVDEHGDEWPVIYLARKTGLSGGWKKFSIDHNLVDGDALVFQLIKPSVFRVFIIRVDHSGNAANGKK
ncbi:B3 domain-containing protein [Striga hermonthica]|uniref:B3 domain-containing protein n=1 Tax=Striga hermonthica TaxID=68872 RepID=A0A9N7N468_STRHE|nr:B3 domain-containing protein [Striga hermonthica]